MPRATASALTDEQAREIARSNPNLRLCLHSDIPISGETNTVMEVVYRALPEPNEIGTHKLTSFQELVNLLPNLAQSISFAFADSQIVIDYVVQLPSFSKIWTLTFLSSELESGFQVFKLDPDGKIIPESAKV